MSLLKALDEGRELREAVMSATRLGQDEKVYFTEDPPIVSLVCIWSEDRWAHFLSFQI